MDRNEGSDLFDGGPPLGEPVNLGEEEGDVAGRLAARRQPVRGLRAYDPHTVTCSRVSLEKQY